MKKVLNIRIQVISWITDSEQLENETPKYQDTGSILSLDGDI
jgi:hypothetical protein